MNAQVSTLDVREGDTLIVHTEEFFTEKQRAQVIEHFKGKFPQVKEVVTLEGGISLATARPGSDELLTEIRDMLKIVTDSIAAGNHLAVEIAA
jgi:hypothetical protein